MGAFFGMARSAAAKNGGPNQAPSNDSSIPENNIVPNLGISIVNLTGDVVASWQGPEDTLTGSVKCDVAQQLSTPVYQVKLVWQGCTLHSKQTLKEQGIPQAAELHLVLEAGVEVQLRTKGYQEKGRHFWSFDPDGRAFHATKEQTTVDFFAGSIVTVETWIVRTGINGLNGSFSLESTTKPDHFLLLDLHSPRESIAAGRTYRQGALLWLVGPEKAHADRDAASFVARPADTGNAFNIYACNLPDKAITHSWARLSATTEIEPGRRNNPDPVELLTAPFENELPLHEALQLLRGYSGS